MRNLGVGFSYTLQSVKSIEKGLSRLEINREALDDELSRHYELLAEPVQTVMRKYDIPNPYEKLKDFTRGKNVTRDDYIRFVESLDMPQDEKAMLKALTPQKYTGYAEDLAKSVRKF